MADESGQSREPPPAGQGPTQSRRPVSYGMVEGGHVTAQAAVSPLRARSRAAFDRVSDPDRELVVRWQRGEQDAFEQLVRRHERRVFNLLLRMLGSREEAEDVAQETFLSLHRHGRRFRKEARFSTFVYRVAVNAALNRRRTLGRRHARVAKLAERQQAGDDLPSTPRDPESAAMGREASERVRQALDALTPRLRLPLVLYDVEGLGYGEVARVLEVAEGTVKSRIHRARRALRKELRGVLRGQREGAAS